MTAPTARTGRVEIRTTTDNRTGRTHIRAAVGVTDFLYEVLEALTDLADQPGDPLGRAFAEVSRCRAEEIEAAGHPDDERHWGERKREAMDELLSLADVAPDPSVLLGLTEVHAIAKAHTAAVFAPAPVGWVPEPQDPWDTPMPAVHPFGDDERSAA